MTLNKSDYTILLEVLNGHDTAAKVQANLPTLNLRSVQRSLVRLHTSDLLIRKGINNPVYGVNYARLLMTDIDAKYLEDDRRPDTKLDFDFFQWLKVSTSDALIFDKLIEVPKIPAHASVISAKDLEYLTVELSWKSSALEGNTYTLLDTQLLLLEGIKAKNKTDFETQMILNHKQAIGFIMENGELFKANISYKTLEHLHQLLTYNLGITPGIRQRVVRITASNYQPLSNPHQLKELLAGSLDILNNTSNPITRALIALALIPYVQGFEDGNKRLGRLLANAILIQTIGRGFSLRKVEAKELALAYIAFYEFRNMSALAQILNAELKQAF